MTWRDCAKPIIREVLERTKDQDEKSIRLALRDAYPFGPRQYHPYRIWCDEVRVQLGLKRYDLKSKKTILREPDERQQEMFT